MNYYYLFYSEPDCQGSPYMATVQGNREYAYNILSAQMSSNPSDRKIYSASLQGATLTYASRYSTDDPWGCQNATGDIYGHALTEITLPFVYPVEMPFTLE